MPASGRCELLNRTVHTYIDGVKREVTAKNEQWVVTALLLEGSISKQDLRRATGNSDSSIRQLIHRSGAHSGLVFDNRRDQGWRLDRTNLSIDAVRFVDLVEGSEVLDPQDRASRLKEARALWQTGLPDFVGLEPPSEEMYLRVARAYGKAAASGRRILVVDDLIADAVADALRVNHLCETARSFEEYQTFESRLGDFDLVVLDRRLRTDRIDSTGDLIAQRINERSDSVPVFMMTYRLPHNVHLDDWQNRLGLAGVVTKEHDGPRAEIDKIAERVNEIFRDGPIDRACAAIESSMVRYRRQARKYLEDRDPPAEAARQIHVMNQRADAVVEKAQVNDLAGARLRRGAFLRNYSLT